MADAPQGRATFPGIEHVISWSFSLAHGVTPSVALLEILPQEFLPFQEGTLAFEFDTQRVEFWDCRVDSHSIVRNAAGFIWQVRIFDRRWRWGWPTISGRYNRHKDGNPLHAVLGTARSPQQLASQCLSEMGETNVDVSQLPNLARPTVDWDLEIAAHALSDIVESLGCRVVLGFEDRVFVRKTGTGQSLPPGGQISNTYTQDIPEKPDILTVVTAPRLFEVDLPLEPVGLDTDGKVRPIDELSYCPDEGWNNYDYLTFGGLSVDAANPTDLTPRRYQQLAQHSVFRWYRVNVPFQVGPLTRIESLAQILPLAGGLMRKVKDHSTGDYVPAPPFVWGVWMDVGAGEFSQRTQAGVGDGWAQTPWQDPRTVQTATDVIFEYQGPTPEAARVVVKESLLARVVQGHHVDYAIDHETGIVRFSQPMLRKMADSSVVRPAALMLRCGIHIRSVVSGQFVRKYHQRVLDNRAKTERLIVREDLEPGTMWLNGRVDATGETASFDANQFVEVDNNAVIDAQAQVYLNDYAARYQTVDAATVHYAGLQPIEPDGQILQVTWQGGVREPVTTTASLNDEQIHLNISYAERRRQERIARLLREQEKRQAAKL